MQTVATSSSKVNASPCVDHADDLTWEIWGDDDYFGAPVVRMFAAFRFLPEALDYVRYCGDRNHGAILRSMSCDGKSYRDTAVYTAEQARRYATGRAVA